MSGMYRVTGAALAVFAASCGQPPESQEVAGDGAAAAAGYVAIDPMSGHGADFSGVWFNNPPQEMRAFQNSAFGPEPPAMTPWAQAKFDEAKPTFGDRAVPVAETNDPVYECFPPGTPRIYFHPFPMEIVQTPGRILMVFEYDHIIRQIWTDGREHRDDLAPMWMGDSTGHWEGDTLVVETTNFNDRTWIDREGVPHSEQLRVLERLHINDNGDLQIDITIEDPVAFPAPWTGQRFYARSDWNIEEFMCMDNVTFEEYENEVLNYEGAESADDGAAADPNSAY
jgi:hypothetical protein